MKGIQVLCGVKMVRDKPSTPYDELVCEFLDFFSKCLRKDKEAKQYSDVMSFAFWIRKANIQKKRELYRKKQRNIKRLGKGVAFHIAPSNIPVNCMFSYVFGLLAGNANIVRVPSKEFPQISCMCRIMNELFRDIRFRDIYLRTSVIRYAINREITDYYSEQCDVRMIWGGDETIQSIRKSEIQSRAIDITFADRYSFGIISVQSILRMSKEELLKLGERFYNDTYLMDQNACSTPHLICWKEDGYSVGEIQKAQTYFWETVSQVALRYNFSDIKASEKYASLCQKIIALDHIRRVETYGGNLLYVCTVDELSENTVEEMRGMFGLFFQYTFRDIEELGILDSVKVQTCAYFGVQPERILESILTDHWKGIDRIVPFGSVLDIDVDWDGYDLISMMSRQIVVT